MNFRLASSANDHNRRDAKLMWQAVSSRFSPRKFCRLVLCCFFLTAFPFSIGAQENHGTPKRPGGLADLSLEELMKIEVTTVSRQASTVGESPAAVFVVTPEMIRRSGATTIPELFRMVPGMDVARIDGNKWAVSTRGFNARFGDKLLVQMDGRTLYNPIFSGVYWDAVDYPLEDIERIEIVRGPGASVWGANAVNGIINIITKSAKDTQGGLVSGGAGTEELGFGTIRYGGKITDNLFYRVYSKGFARDEQVSNTGNPHDDWWGSSTGFRLDWQPSEHDAVTFDGGYLHSDAGRKDLRAMSTAPFSFTNIESEITDAGHILGRWTHEFDEDNRFTLLAYWDRFDREADNLRIHVGWDTYDLDFQHQFPVGDRQKIVWGLGYRFIDADLGSTRRDNGFTVSFSDRRLQLWSAFVQDQIELIKDKFSLTLGSKFEINDFTGFEVEPTARLLWTPSRRQSVWFAVSRAVRTPTVAEDIATSRSLPVSTAPPIFPRVTPNTNLDSEEVLAYELGYRAQATETLSVDIALFYNVYDNLSVRVPGAVTPDPATGTSFIPLTPQNAMNGETYGLELAATWKPTAWWRLFGAYTFLEMQLHREIAAVKSQEIGREGGSPQHQIYLQSSWTLPGRVELDLMGRFVDQLSGFNPSAPTAAIPDKISGYVSLDARLAWRPRKNIEVAVIGQNLLDSHHPESGTSTSIQAPLVEIQRAIYGKITWTF